MDIIVLNDRQQLQSLGTLHAARPAEPGTGRPEPLTFCRRPTQGRTVVGASSTASHTTWYPEELADTAARCTACMAYVHQHG